MIQLNLPSYPHKITEKSNTKYIYDILRKKYVPLTPEEWVRQHMIHYLINHLGYHPPLMNIEKTLTQVGRADILTYHPSGEIHMIIECKKPQQSIAQPDLAQIGRYNRYIKAPLITITNGIQNIAFQCSTQDSYHILPNIPTYAKKDTLPHSL